MAKKHKNLDNILIQWDGDLSHPQAGDANQSIPASVDLGTWGGYVPGWYPDKHATFTPVYFEDYNIVNYPIAINVNDAITWSAFGRSDIADEIVNMIVVVPHIFTPKGPKNQSWTWGDVSFAIEIADGLGTGNRRAREARLQQLDRDKKKRLIRLICRVKGEEEVYDETKEVYPGDIQIKLDDVDMVISKVLGTMKVSTEWEEVPWDYRYDK